MPLHSSVAGKKYGEFIGEDRNTTRESERLVRLPMFYALKDEEVKETAYKIKPFYKLGGGKKYVEVGNYCEKAAKKGDS